MITGPCFAVEGHAFRLRLQTTLATIQRVSVLIAAVHGPTDVHSLAGWQRTAHVVLKLRTRFSGKDEFATICNKGIRQVSWEASDEEQEAEWKPLCEVEMQELGEEVVVLTKVFAHEDLGRSDPNRGGDEVATDDGISPKELCDEVSLADVHLVLGDVAIPVSRAVLALRSDYFRRLFAHESSQVSADCSLVDVKVEDRNNGNLSTAANSVATLPRISLDEPDVWAFTTLLHYLIMGLVPHQSCTDQNADNSDNRALRLLRIATNYNCPSLRSRAVRSILASLTPENCVQWLFRHSDDYPDLRADLLDYVVGRFDEVKIADSFQDLLSEASQFRSFAPIMMEIFTRTSIRRS
ncbi:hypothetical protein HKX48_006850 [Thoreauomyces humboldtii]|nr:hypothetical protein HKX48_006850 [Thoreauomyces humboldtii]